jgi:hypothetical protein
MANAAQMTQTVAGPQSRPLGVTANSFEDLRWVGQSDH